MLRIGRGSQGRLGFSERDKEQVKKREKRNRRGKGRRIMEIWRALSKWRGLDGKGRRKGL